jgi:hypothetical protein
LDGRCNECGIDALVNCPLEEDVISEKLMKWKCYEPVVHVNIRARKDCKVLKL